MNWDIAGALGEIVGALGVVFSVVYLAIQVRRDADARLAETSHSLSVRSGEIQESLSTNPQLADVFVRGMEDLASLKQSEQAQFNAFLGAVFRTYEDACFQKESRLFDETLWQAYQRSMPDFLAAPGIATWWSMRRNWYSQEFQDYVDRSIGTGNWPGFRR